MKDQLSRPSFAVLLAAYNGVEWLESQVATILSQRDVSVTIFVSIDLSSDTTESWFRLLASQNPHVVILPVGERFGGAAKNFFRLVRDVEFSSFDYISFADQDDIWLEDKLYTAHQKLVKHAASGYSGNVTAFWPNGRKVLIDKAQCQKKYDYIFEAAGPGCTYVLKAADALCFKEFLLKNWISISAVSLHDWLIYAWFRANGLKWYIDPNPKMFYRQHDNNQVGANSGFKAIKARINLLRTGWYRREVSKIASLLGASLPSVLGNLPKDGMISKSFVLSRFCQLRRRFRDQVFLLLIVIVGIY